MKLIGNKVSSVIDDEGNLIVSLTIPRGMYQNQLNAKKVVQSLKEVDLISCELKVNEKSRSYEQNALAWKLLNLIVEHETGHHRQSDVWKLYGEMLIEANIKYEYIRTYEKARPILEQYFRAVVDVPNSSKTEKDGNVTKMYMAFYGSSTFTTSEMSKLVDCILDRCAKLGVEV